MNGDDAHALFTRTFNPALLQKAVAIKSKVGSQVSKLLSDAAHKFSNPRLATLAVQDDLIAKVEDLLGDDDRAVNQGD